MTTSKAAPWRSSTAITLVLALSTCLSISTPALAVDSTERSAARQLAQQGVEAYQAEDYEKALDRLERAYEILPTPALALWTARALEKVGRWVEASELYLQATRIAIDRQGDTQVQEESRKEATTARERLIKRIPTLVVEVQGATGEVEVQVGKRTIGAALIGADLPSDPGSVHIVARADGRTIERDVTLAEGERKTVTLAFDGAPSATSTEKEARPAPSAATTATPQDASPRSGSWQKPVGWIAIGLGAASIGVGAGFGLDAMAKRDESASDCDENDVCGTTGTNLRNAGMTSAAISTATFAAGAALAAGGVVLLLTAPRKETTSSLHLVPTFGGAGVSWRGQF